MRHRKQWNVVLLQYSQERTDEQSERGVDCLEEEVRQHSVIQFTARNGHWETFQCEEVGFQEPGTLTYWNSCDGFKYSMLTSWRWRWSCRIIEPETRQGVALFLPSLRSARNLLSLLKAPNQLSNASRNTNRALSAHYSHSITTTWAQ